MSDDMRNARPAPGAPKSAAGQRGRFQSTPPARRQTVTHVYRVRWRRVDWKDTSISSRIFERRHDVERFLTDLRFGDEYADLSPLDLLTVEERRVGPWQAVAL